MNNYFLTLLGVFGAILGYKYMSASRGVRNNNPLNIEYNPANKWVGQTGVEEKGRFAVFSSPVYGFRAAMKIFNSYRSRGINTLSDIISTWAPENENDTANYINYVSNRTGIPANQDVNTSDYPAIVKAMAKMETGEEWPNNLIQQAFSMV